MNTDKEVSETHELNGRQTGVLKGTGVLFLNEMVRRFSTHFKPHCMGLNGKAFSAVQTWRCRWTALRDIPTRLPISPSAIAATQYRIKIRCSCSGRLAKAPSRTGKPQETTKFARQVIDPPGENESDMKLIYMV